MAGRIVVFGATGYTGELTARRPRESVVPGRRWRVWRTATVWLDWPPSWAAWNRRVPDVDRPGSVRALVERGERLGVHRRPVLAVR